MEFVDQSAGKPPEKSSDQIGVNDDELLFGLTATSAAILVSGKSKKYEKILSNYYSNYIFIYFF